jgi:hypothetical protein
MTAFAYCCPICGAPITEEWPASSWIRDAVLLSDYPPVLEEPGCEFTCEDGVYLTKAFADEDVGRDCFHMNGSGEMIDVGFYTFSSPENPCLIAVHQSCWDIAKRVVAVAPETGSEGGSVTSMKKLYEFLLARMSRSEFNFQLSEPHNYFIDNYPFIENLGDAWGCTIADANPYSFPDPTDFIISLLKPLPSASENNSSLAHINLKSSIENLPVEIADLVTENLSPLKNLPLQCTRVLPQAFWTQALLSGNLFPWLWDLDIKKIEEKLAMSTEINGWDVERPTIPKRIRKLLYQMS